MTDYLFFPSRELGLSGALFESSNMFHNYTQVFQWSYSCLATIHNCRPETSFKICLGELNVDLLTFSVSNLVQLSTSVHCAHLFNAHHVFYREKD